MYTKLSQAFNEPYKYSHATTSKCPDDVGTRIRTILSFKLKSYLPVAGELGAMVSHFVWRVEGSK